MRKDVDLERVGQRVERLLDELAAAHPAAADAAEEVVRELLGLYGEALGRILEVIDTDASLVRRLSEDPLVAGLLTVHDLHPLDVTTRVEQALDGIRPYLGSHGGDVELLGIDGDTVRLRLLGSCDGCGASAVTLKHAVEGAIHDAAPEIGRLEVEGAVAREGDGGLIPLEALIVRTGAAWTGLDPVGVPNGRLDAREVAGHRIVVTRLGHDLFAYRDGCPSCGATLDDTVVAHTVAACRGCGQRYDLRFAGRSLDGEDLALEPVPLVEDLSGVRIALEAAS